MASAFSEAPFMNYLDCCASMLYDCFTLHLAVSDGDIPVEQVFKLLE